MKGSKTILAVILGTLLVTGIACGGTSESPTPTPTGTPTTNEVNVDASYNGSEITLAVGEQLIVTLVSNPGSTGFSWNLSAISDSDVIQYVSDEYIAPEQTDPPMVGVPGEEVWTFEALGAGTGAISMKYIQPWASEAEPAETFEITVNVE
ncbi:MAG: protease inhibitor I42 family protein [Dehalococcoidia bacterium]|jgi:inhibitor of cysteine peptidase